MAKPLTKHDLINGALAQLNKNFSKQYDFSQPLSRIIDERHTSREAMKEAAQMPLFALRDLWLVRFGDSVDAQDLLEHERIMSNEFMVAVGATLRRWGFLEYNHASQKFILHNKPTYADYRQQSSPIQDTLTHQVQHHP